jgi:hypothetical protein
VAPLALLDYGVSDMRRVVLRVLALLAMLACMHAHAVIPKVGGYRVSNTLVPAARFDPTPEAACQYYIVVQAAAQPSLNYVYVSATTSRCNWSRSGGTGFTEITFTAGSACPANSTVSGSACQCNSAYAENSAHNACELNQANCTPGQAVRGGFFDAGATIAKGPAYIVCNNGCASAFDGEFPSGSALVGGTKHYFAKGSYSMTGSKCDSGGGVGVPSGAGNAPTATDGVPADTCAPGEAAGVVNGKSVCAPDMSAPGAGNQPAPTPDQPKSDDKTTTESASQTVTNADGSKTTTTTTTVKNVDGTSTTTTTTGTVNADGSPRSSSSTTSGSGVTKAADEKAKEKCEKNSSDTGCGGDPSQVSAGGLYTKKQKTFQSVLVSGRDAMSASPAGAAVSGFFDVSGGGSCPVSNGSFSLFGKSIAFAFDGFCTDMASRVMLAIKGVLLLLASVWAFRAAIE